MLFIYAALVDWDTLFMIDAMKSERFSKAHKALGHNGINGNRNRDRYTHLSNSRSPGRLSLHCRHRSIRPPHRHMAQHGLNPPEEIVQNFGYVSLAQVHAALAYYYANKAEIDADIEAKLAWPMHSKSNMSAYPNCERIRTLHRRRCDGQKACRRPSRTEHPCDHGPRGKSRK